MGADRTFPWPRLAFSRGRRTTSGEAGRDGAPERFRRLVMPHLDAAYSYARYLARDGSAAEDIVQDAFLRAWKGFHGCRGNEKSWLLAIVRNCFHDWVRAANNPLAQAGWIEDFEDTTGDDQTEDMLLRELDIAVLREAIVELPEPFRETLVLRELEELSYRDIAVLTATPIGTVMSRLARGRAMLGKLVLSHNSRGAMRS